MSTQNNGKLSMGPGTLEVPLELFALNRQRLIERVKPKALEKSVILLQGGDEVPFYDTDTTYNVFRQESYFMWAFGVMEPGCFGAIEIDSGISHLFVPHYPDSYAVWMGPLHPPNYYGTKYNVDKVHYSKEIASTLEQLNPSTILTVFGINSDSGLSFKEATFEGIERFEVNNTIVFNEIADLRVYKTDFELQVIKYVVDVSSAAHRKVMRFATAGQTEYQCESEFLHHCYSVGGCRHVSYTCICATGLNSAVLHYGHAAAPNDRIIKSNELCLFDMGANYLGYAADITCTFPVNGKFSPDQKLIYEAVLAANLTVQRAAKPGVSWSDMHILAVRVVLRELKKGGLLKGDVEEMIIAGLGAIFQPHGLGHLLGLDVHDVGGYNIEGHPLRLTVPNGIEKLRTARVLEDRMVLTIEPGCYFVDFLLDQAFKDPQLKEFLVPDSINRFRGFGGVRIEDDVMITKDGVVNLTKVPRTVEEIENWIDGKDDEKYI